MNLSTYTESPLIYNENIEDNELIITHTGPNTYVKESGDEKKQQIRCFKHNED